MSSVLIVVTLPTTRTDGTALAPSDIDSVVVSKSVDGAANTAITTLHGPFTGPTVSTTDNAPDTGHTDTYTAMVFDTSGQKSGDSNAVAVTIPVQLAPPSAPSITAVLQA